MRKLYPTLFFAAIISSCGVSVNYLGSSFNRTSQVDVYVDESAIRRPYKIIGKGYEQPGLYTRFNIERLQKSAVEKAKANGADAVFFQDYFLLQPGTAVSSTTRTDTLTKAVVSTTTGYAGPVISSGRQILFLKYE